MNSTQPRMSTHQKMAVARLGKAFEGYTEIKKAKASIAKAVVSVRLMFEKDGRPDYRGDTQEYRAAVATVYEAAIPDPEERRSFKTSLRYWIYKEYVERVESGEIKRKHLAEAGIFKPTGVKAPKVSKPEENGDAPDFDPKVLLASVERAAQDETIAPVVALQSTVKTLGPTVAGLRDKKTPSTKALRQATEQVLGLALDAATLAGIDIEDFVASWVVQHEDLATV